MPSWFPEPIATFTGSWSFSFSLPGAALDDQGNLLIAWADDAQKLNLAYTEPGPGKVALNPITPDVGATQGSPGVAFSNGKFYVFWRDARTGQLQFGTVTQSLTDFTNQGFLTGANSTDGPQVTVDPSGAIIWVGWRGNNADDINDQSLYFSNLAEGGWSTEFLQGGSALNSLYSPAMGVLQDSSSRTPFLCTVHDGAVGDAQLYSAWRSLGEFQSHQFVEADTLVLSTNNRPSFVVSPSRDSALLVYQNGQTLFSTSTTLSGFQGAPGQWSTAMIVPTDPMSNPVGVLVTQATASSPAYLLVADGPNGVVNSAMVLYQYNWS